jgi:hypothetical protein
VPYVDKVKSVKKHWGFPTEVSDMARNMSLSFHTHRRMGHGFRFSPFLYCPPFFQNFHINHSFFKIIRFFFTGLNICIVRIIKEIFI